ncbi:MAG: DUF389 domain-containing protein [Methylotenera sp.]
MSEASYFVPLFRRGIIAIRHRFSLIEDKADDGLIDHSIRSGVVLRGTNLWVLMFAILIASIGLNVNSTAVIIGAMLISPLMGPIMGIGYGVGIYDAALIRKSFRNLGIATLISLLVSTLYFLLTPLADAQSELLARTSPTIWDVLIAFFGGLAGIIGATRSEKTNIIPGVAIATALMPPLCTAGYGLANGNWEFFFGAFYLYSINCVFIAFAAILIIWVLNPSHKLFVDEKTETRVSRVLTAIVLLTLLPSVYLAVKLVKEEVFSSRARTFISKELTFEQAHLTERSITPAKRQIEVALIGDLISHEKLKDIEARLMSYGLDHTKLLVHQSKDNTVDVTALKSNIVSELYKDNLHALDEKNKTIQNLQAELQGISANKAMWRNISAELHAQYPQIREVLFSEAVRWKVDDDKADGKQIVLNITASSKLSNSDRYRIIEWLKVRIQTDSIRLVVD